MISTGFLKIFFELDELDLLINFSHKVNINLISRVMINEYLCHHVDDKI